MELILLCILCRIQNQSNIGSKKYSHDIGFHIVQGNDCLRIRLGSCQEIFSFRYLKQYICKWYLSTLNGIIRLCIILSPNILIPLVILKIDDIKLSLENKGSYDNVSKTSFHFLIMLLIWIDDLFHARMLFNIFVEFSVF